MTQNYPKKCFIGSPFTSPTFLHRGMNSSIDFRTSSILMAFLQFLLMDAFNSSRNFLMFLLTVTGFQFFEGNSRHILAPYQPFSSKISLIKFKSSGDSGLQHVFFGCFCLRGITTFTCQQMTKKRFFNLFARLLGRETIKSIYQTTITCVIDLDIPHGSS